MQTAEIDVARDRRVTLTSPIPAIIADSIVRERSITPRRDPAAPRLEAVEHTRRVGDSDPVRSGSGPTLKSDVGVAPWRQRAAQRIDEARAALDAGDLTAAVTAAEAALREADEAPAARHRRGDRAGAAAADARLRRPTSVRSTGVPVLAPRADEIARHAPGRARARASCGASTARARWKSCSTARASDRPMPCASSRG